MRKDLTLQEIFLSSSRCLPSHRTSVSKIMSLKVCLRCALKQSWSCVTSASVSRSWLSTVWRRVETALSRDSLSWVWSLIRKFAWEFRSDVKANARGRCGPFTRSTTTIPYFWRHAVIIKENTYVFFQVIELLLTYNASRKRHLCILLYKNSALIFKFISIFIKLHYNFWESSCFLCNFY